MLATEQGLEETSRECQSAFVALHLLEASERALHEDFAAVVEAEGNSDLHLAGMTDEEIEDQAKRLIRRAHAEKLRELEEQIATVKWP